MYNEEDYERCFEPSIANDLLMEYQQKMKEALLESVKNQFETSICENVKLKQENEKLYKQIRELKEKNIKSEKEHEKALKEKEKDIVRDMTKGFAPYDDVWYIEANNTQTVCTHCNGNYKIKVEILGIEKEVNCPHCSYGAVNNYTFYPKKDRVSSIYFKYHRINTSIYAGDIVLCVEKIYLDNLDYEEKSENLYKTKEECQIECDKKNLK